MVSRQKRRMVSAALFWVLTGVLALVCVLSLFAAFAFWIEPHVGAPLALMATAGLAIALIAVVTTARWLVKKAGSRRTPRPDPARDMLLALTPAIAASDKRIFFVAAVVAGYAFGSALTGSRRQ